jgi:hypothetical protein
VGAPVGTTGYAYVADRVVQLYGAKNELLQYDHAGRLVSRRPTTTNFSTAAELEGFGWDVQDQLRQVRTAGAVSEVIDYDPTGLPLFRRVGGVGTWYVGKMATVTATVSTTCTGAATCLPTTTPAVAVHLLLGGTRLATVKAPLPSAPSAFAEVLYYHRDYQGSVIGTSRRGAGVDGLSGAQYRYTPYGQLDKVTGVTAQTDSELGYTGGLRLGYVAGAVTSLAAPQAPGLVLLGARVYHPELKRWLVPDTVDPLRYTYTGGDPVNFIDPSGRTRIDGHSLDLKSRPVMFEDYFMSITAQYATAGFDTAMRHLREDLAWAAGNQGPVPQWESAYRAELARASSQYLNDVVAEAMASGDAFAREAATRGWAEQSERVLAQAYAELVSAGKAAYGAMIGNTYLLNQDTGAFSGYRNGSGSQQFLQSTGYSGSNIYDGIMIGVNNHDAEPYAYVGPTPVGIYKTGKVDNSISVNTIRLEPDTATRAYIRSLGRDPDSFRIHGSGSVPYSGSEGCTILTPAVRAIIKENPGTVIIYHSP